MVSLFEKLTPQGRREAMRQFWLERFTLAEIRAMAGAFDALLNDHSGPAAERHRDHLVLAGRERRAA